jgi:hypothetical protein
VGDIYIYLFSSLFFLFGVRRRVCGSQGRKCQGYLRYKFKNKKLLVLVVVVVTVQNLWDGYHELVAGQLNLEYIYVIYI